MGGRLVWPTYELRAGQRLEFMKVWGRKGGAKQPIQIRKHYTPENDATLFHGDRLDMLREIPDGSAQLAVTSPPYNIGKSYETIITLDD